MGDFTGIYEIFLTYLYLGPGRTIRKAYKTWCVKNGEEPKKNPSSTWYQLYKGEYQAFRRAEMQSKAIEKAGEIHGRSPDWDKLTAIAEKEGLLGKYSGEEGEIMDELTLIDFAFHSLSIDNNGGSNTRNVDLGREK